MHERFLEILADPHTNERLTLEDAVRKGPLIESGWLTSSTGRYPIRDGVPRFAGDNAENYADSFAYQWRRWPRLQFDSSNIGRPMEGYTRRMWERITGVEGEPFTTEDIVLDLGCGPGRFTDITRAKGASVLAIDYSAAADVAAANFRSDPDVCVVQADALHLPIRAGSLAAAFSIGVLHHTPDPPRGVSQMAKAVRPGGWVAVSVYARKGYYNFPTVQLWRSLFSRLPVRIAEMVALAYSYAAVVAARPFRRVPALANVIRVPLPSVQLPDFEWSLLDTFDSVTPAHQSGHETFEVFTWFTEAGLCSVQPSDWGPTTMRGNRPGD